MKMRHVGYVCVIILVVIASQAWGASSELEKIQQAIQQRGARWEAAQTPYTDLTLEQKKAMLGILGPPDQELQRSLPPFPYEFDEVDQEVDWRNRNGHDWVTPVKDQGPCGSCWAFGCAAALESSILIAANTPNYPIDLSEQYLVSCSPGSCNGWYAVGTLNFMQNQGISDEVCLPYGATDLIPCSERCDDYLFRLSRVSSWGACNGVAAMKNALNAGPISATFEVFNDFYSYNEGVYQHTYGPSVGWHLICIVGYSDIQNAWICKNSWGENWGMDGYFLIRMGYNECHIEEGCDWLLPAQAQYPNISLGEVQVNDQGGGDGDGVLNPGETVNLAIPLINAPLTAPANHLTAHIGTQDPRVTILDEEATYPNLQAGLTVNNLDPFTFRVAPGCNLGTIEFTLDVYANDTATVPYYVVRNFKIDVSLYQPGYPIIGSEADGSPAIYDLDNNGYQDVIYGDFSGKLRAVNGSGQTLPGFPYQIQGMIKSTPAIADLDGDSDVEIVFTGWTGYLYILNANGTEAINPVNLTFFISASPALIDLDNDQDLEIVVGSWNGKMYAFHHDGTLVTGFPFDAGSYQCIQDEALLMDLNNDNLPEILFGANNGRFYAISGSGQELWHVDLGNLPAGAASAGELDPGITTIIVPDAAGYVHYLNTSGQQQRLVNLGHSCKCSPSLADLDADGHLEVAINDQAGGIHMLTSQGQELPGFPVQVGSGIWASTSFADVDNDYWLDLVVADLIGNLHVITHTGANITPFPLTLGSGSRSTPTIANLDIDVYYEITLGSYDGLYSVDPKLDAGTSGAWNQYRGNSQRTGNYSDGGFTSVAPPNSKSEIPRTTALLPVHPNPFNPATMITFQMSRAGHVNLKVYDVAGRLVANLLDETRSAGTYDVRFNGESLTSGLYFVRMATGDFTAVKKMMLLK